MEMEYMSGEGCPTSSGSSSPPPAVVVSPCAACKTLRRRCLAERCVLAPYFPPTEPHKFTIAHRVFGASNIIKLLQEVGEGERADAVKSMVYEANARLRDPIYGCAGAICHLQKRIDDLQAELAKANAQILNMQCQNANLLHQYDHHLQQTTLPYEYEYEYEYDHQTTFLFDDQTVSWT